MWKKYTWRQLHTFRPRHYLGQGSLTLGYNCTTTKIVQFPLFLVLLLLSPLMTSTWFLHLDIPHWQPSSHFVTYHTAFHDHACHAMTLYMMSYNIIRVSSCSYITWQAYYEQEYCWKCLLLVLLLLCQNILRRKLFLPDCRKHTK
jgi:hypothetical protein